MVSLWGSKSGGDDENEAVIPAEGEQTESVVVIPRQSLHRDPDNPSRLVIERDPDERSRLLPSSRGHDRGHDRGFDRGYDRGRERGHDRYLDPDDPAVSLFKYILPSSLRN